MLQIGAYSGKSSEWMLIKVDTTCVLTDVNTWIGSSKKDGL